MNRPNDEPNQDPTSRPTPPPGRSSSQGLRFKLAALALMLVSALFATGLALRLKPQPPQPEPEMKIPARLFPGWEKPDFVVLLSAQQHGYMLPCGCSRPQKGGLERRYNFMQLLKARGWPVVAVDLGEVPQKGGPVDLPNVQGLLKYTYSMKALKEMGYLGVGVGKYEAALSLTTILGAWALNEDTPAVLVANLDNAAANFPGFKPLAIQTVPGTNLKVGVTNIIGQTIAEKIQDPAVQFAKTIPAVEGVLKEMDQQKVDLPLLLYQGHATGDQLAVKCAEHFPQFPIVLCLSEEDEPPMNMMDVKNPQTGATSYLVRLGQKGKYVGVLGVYRNPQGNRPFSFKYQLVEMGEEYMTPPNQEANHPIVKMMEDYTRDLQKDNYLSKYGPKNHYLQAMPPVPGLRNPGNGVPTYIGTEACKKCHEDAYDVWKKTPHSHAYQTLVDAKRPSLRQFDGECIVCHTVGFGYKSGFTSAVQTKQLENVGCESCHGPGSLHAKNPENEEWKARMNQLWRGAAPNRKELKIETQLCITCHDIDNDVTWQHDKTHDPFKEKWGKIVHPTPR
jgi:hypothetical protein